MLSCAQNFDAAKKKYETAKAKADAKGETSDKCVNRTTHCI